MLLRKSLSLLTLLLLAGCDKNNATPPLSSAATTTNPPTLYLDHALPKLDTIKLWIGPEVLETEMVTNHTQIATGMMYRKEMGTNAGMLFIFARPIKVSFYMRNTTIPLSCAYIDPDGTILEIHDMKPLDETPIEASSRNVQYVAEAPQGWFKRNNVGVGALVRTERGSLFETFFRSPEP